MSRKNDNDKTSIIEIVSIGDLTSALLCGKRDYHKEFKLNLETVAKL